MEKDDPPAKPVVDGPKDFSAPGASISESQQIDFSPHGNIRPRHAATSRGGGHDEPYEKHLKRYRSAQKEEFDVFRPAQGEAVQPPAESSPSPKRSSRPADPKALLLSWAATVIGYRVPVLPLVLVMALAAIWIIHLAKSDGILEGHRLAEEKAIPDPVAMLPEARLQFEQAMTDLRNGRSKEALRSLQALDQSSTAYPSMPYLVSMAAWRSGDRKLAAEKAAESILKGERVSDALTLQALLDWQSETPPGKEAVERAEGLLRKAIMIDPANPWPHFELANFYRSQDKREAAMAEFRAARNLLNPLDNHLILDIKTSFLAMEEAPAEGFSRESPRSDDVRKLFPAALAAMRTRDFDRAAKLLAECRQSLPPDVFRLLLEDPVFQSYSAQPALKEFFTR